MVDRERYARSSRSVGERAGVGCFYLALALGTLTSLAAGGLVVVLVLALVDYLQRH